MDVARIDRLVLGCLLASLLAGCTQHYFSARMPNADGRGHAALASWSVTERALWFDESSETVRVQLECGLTVAFQEREGGIYVLDDPSVWSGARALAGGTYCGRVVGASTLLDIAAGEPLTVELWCDRRWDDEELTLAAPILPPGEHTFEPVQRSEHAAALAPCPAREPASDPPTSHARAHGLQ